MDTVERIFMLLHKNAVEQKDLAQALGIRKQAITEWKKGTTQSYKKYIKQIADFFNVTTDYLLLGEQKKINSSDKEEFISKLLQENDDFKALTEIMENLSPEKQKRLLNLARFELFEQEQEQGK